MNKQDKGDGRRGIEWCTHTWNVIGGCKHRCRWDMPDGTTAICYAEAVANGVARDAYKNGFEHHYWNPQRLEEPLKLKEPARIFLDSMSDLMGHWVPDAHINQVLDICEKAHWHTFQLLTKNAPRLLKFDMPPNVWVGASMPPAQMFGNNLNEKQQIAMLRTTLQVLSAVKAPVRWMSFEPMSWDCAWIVRDEAPELEWSVIGAATNGPKAFQPDPMHLIDLLAVLDEQKTAVFFKGNLKWHDWREEYPAVRADIQAVQKSLF